MADGAEALEKIFLEIVKIVRTHPGWCVGVTSHLAFTPKLKPVEAANKEVAKALLNDLEDIQWTANNETFFDLIELVEMKYLKNNLLDANTVSV